MLRTVKTPESWDDYASVTPLVLGGTGVKTVAEAQAALGAIPASSIGVPGGPLPLDEDGVVDSKYLGGVLSRDISIDGSDYILPGETKEWLMTTYDCFTDYKITAILGTVKRDGAVISFTAGNLTGSGGFVINGRPVKISIGGGSVLAPEILSPSEEGMISPSFLTITASEFTVVGVDTHLSTDWEIAFDEDFVFIKASSYDDTVNLTTWSLEDMDWNTRYYVRARYHGTNKGAGEWSASSNFMTNSLWGQTGVIYSSDTVTTDQFGDSVALNTDGTYAIVGANASDTKATDGGCAYIFTRSGKVWTQAAKLTAGDGAKTDSFGYSCALNGDATIAMVGAQGQDTKATDAGAVYVYTRSGTTWTQLTKLMASDGAAGDNFGSSIAMNYAGDLAIIGAPAHDDNASNSGSIYVFSRSGTTWTQQQKKQPSSPSANAYFGTGCALNKEGTYAIVAGSGIVYGFSISGTTWTQVTTFASSDTTSGGLGSSCSMNEDATVAVIGAQSSSAKGTNSGSVYVFTRAGNTWIEQQRINPIQELAGDHAGVAAISGNGTIIIIGSYADDDKVTDGGCVYTYTLASKDYPKEFFYRINASDGAASDAFGVACALNNTGDYALIGANSDDDKGTDSGSAYVFVRSGGVWTQQQKLYASDAAAGDNFGVSVGLNSDATIALIGAHTDNDTATGSGSVYYFTRSGTTWTQVSKLHASDAAAGDNFGHGLAINSTGEHALIGALADDDTVADSGSVYYFTRSGNVWTQIAKLHASDAANGDSFGATMALNADGTIGLIGAYADDDTATDSGSVYHFTRSGTTWTQTGKIHAPDPAAADQFGRSVAMNTAGDLAFIGAQWDDDKATDSGSIYVFNLINGAWVYVDKLLSPDGVASDTFGRSCSLTGDGTIAIIGANAKDLTYTDQGAVYFYRLPPFIWPNAEKGKIYASDFAANDAFGTSVALSAASDYALVGAYADDDKGTDTGSVYAFTRSGSVWTQQQKLYASDPVASVYFGASVALNSDATIALIGAFYDKTKATDAGAVYYFTRSGTVWTQISKIYASDAAAGDVFGVSCALSSDGTMALIGAYCDDDTLTDSGSVYYFTRSGSVWTQISKLHSSIPKNTGNFGTAVALSADGLHALIGEHRNSDKATDAGTVYYFTRSGTTWTQVSKFYASGLVAADYFGVGVALNADATIAYVSAIGDDMKASACGCVYIFTRSGSVWTEQKKLTPSDGGANWQFGRGCALNAAGDLGTVGGMYDSTKATSAGSVYLFG